MYLHKVIILGGREREKIFIEYNMGNVYIFYDDICFKLWYKNEDSYNTKDVASFRNMGDYFSGNITLQK